MSGNIYGSVFRIASFGESHGAGVGVVVDGVPPGLPLTADDVNFELARRRPGQSKLTTRRMEPDRCEILSGVSDGRTLGSPVAILVRNEDARPQAYDEMKELYRPSHADFTYEKKYGVPMISGGGRSSARETIARVAGGVVARKVLATFGRSGAPPIEIIAYVKSIHTIQADIDSDTVTMADVESNPVRCPDAAAAKIMAARIDEARRAGDSVGGVIECIARHVPIGWGDPVFDKLEASLAMGMLSLPAAKGFENGSGFSGTSLYGSEHNDAFIPKEGGTGTLTNRSGGIQGGISNGETIVVRVAFKPTATINKEQDTVDRSGNARKLKAKGRHDPCVLPRAVPIVEAMMALTLADHALRHRAQCG